jgi:hypothetical protein
MPQALKTFVYALLCAAAKTKTLSMARSDHISGSLARTGIAHLFGPVVSKEEVDLKPLSKTVLARVRSVKVGSECWARTSIHVEIVEEIAGDRVDTAQSRIPVTEHADLFHLSKLIVFVAVRPESQGLQRRESGKPQHMSFT